jgi:hypothetical protein
MFSCFAVIIYANEEHNIFDNEVWLASIISSLVLFLGEREYWVDGSGRQLRN